MELIKIALYSLAILTSLGCTVLLEPVAFSGHRAVSARTTAGGKFVFQDVPAGSARLT